MNEEEIKTEKLKTSFASPCVLGLNFTDLVEAISNSYEDSREREEALTKIEEAELWLRKAKRKE